MNNFSTKEDRVKFALGLLIATSKLRPEEASRINTTFEDTPDSLLERVTLDFPNGVWTTIALNTPFKVMRTKEGQEGEAPRGEVDAGVRGRLGKVGGPETIREAIADGMQAARETAQADDEFPYVRTSDVENWVRASVTDFIRNSLAVQSLDTAPGTLAHELLRRLGEKLLK